jgi:tetratricopeptide (TPR) repeat protein
MNPKIPVDIYGNHITSISSDPFPSFGSKKFWSEDRIEKFITNIAEQTKAQIHPEGSPKTINFTKAIREWATNYGFGAAQAKAEIDKWVAQVKEKEDDLHKLGLAAFAEKKFGKAESLFKQSAGAKIKSLKAVKAQEQQLTIEIISDYRLAGDSAYNNYKFHEAMNNYEMAASYATRETQPRLWAQIQVEIGNASAQKGIRAESHEVNEYLKKSVSVYRNALKVYTRDQLPQQWAMTQNNLGTALKEQGIRTGGEQGKTLLAEAVEAFESALEVFKAARMGWHVGITEKNIDEAMEELNAIDGGK